jgi:SAM-dependent methyltransferase
MAESPTVRASVALAACVESLADGRRVVVFGDARSGLAEQLLERGARLVHVYDPEPAHAAEAAARNHSRNVTFAPLPEDSLGVRDGAFDLAIVEDLSRLPAPAELLRRTARVLGPRGVAIVAAPNPEVTARLSSADEPGTALDYYALYDLVAAAFEQVTMYGQAPFVGYAVAAFGLEGEPSPVFDQSFMPAGAEAPEWFWAVGGAPADALEDFSVVQVPLAWTARSAPPADDTRELRREVQQREQWIAELEARATAADARADTAQGEVEEVSRRVTAADAQTRSAAHRATELERELGAARAESKSLRQELERELGAARAESKSLRQELERELGAARAESKSLRQELEALRAEVEPLRVRTDDLGRELEALSGLEAQAAEDQARLEAQLLDRAQEIQRLQREAREAERVGKELLHELEDRPPADAAAADLLAKVDALATRNAQREGDLAAARYQLQVLQADLEEIRRDAAERLAASHSEMQRQATLLEQARSGAGPDHEKES